mmetsp:Transcript_16328/g.30080  ORF Transcript_16328/g.30080 Transcript_16328/m.30080 type:complete len:232 (-) Transcript_16328:561-1256(-)
MICLLLLSQPHQSHSTAESSRGKVTNRRWSLPCWRRRSTSARRQTSVRSSGFMAWRGSSATCRTPSSLLQAMSCAPSRTWDSCGHMPCEPSYWMHSFRLSSLTEDDKSTVPLSAVAARRSALSWAVARTASPPPWAWERQARLRPSSSAKTRRHKRQSWTPWCTLLLTVSRAARKVTTWSCDAHPLPKCAQIFWSTSIISAALELREAGRALQQAAHLQRMEKPPRHKTAR